MIVHISVYSQRRGRLVKQLVACQQRTALAAVWLQWPWDSLLLLAPFTNHSPLQLLLPFSFSSGNLFTIVYEALISE